MLRIYFDNCCFQRPRDDLSQVRVVLESEAFLSILGLCDTGKVEIVSSGALLYEIRQVKNPVRRSLALRSLAKATIFVALDKQSQNRVAALIKKGIKPLDAVHLALAEKSQADYFCTCDDRLLKKARTLKDLKTKVISLLELIGEVEK